MKVAVRCVEERIAVFSPHTSWDAVNGGINNWLLEPYGSGQVGHCLENLAQREREKNGTEKEREAEKRKNKSAKCWGGRKMSRRGKKGRLVLKS